MHRIERANRLLRNSRIIILVGFGLLAVATLALIIGLFRSREADMWVVHTFQVQQTAQGVADLDPRRRERGPQLPSQLG